jgi:hypothetical protein
VRWAGLSAGHVLGNSLERTSIHREAIRPAAGKSTTTGPFLIGVFVGLSRPGAGQTRETVGKMDSSFFRERREWTVAVGTVSPISRDRGLRCSAFLGVS